MEKRISGPVNRSSWRAVGVAAGLALLAGLVATPASADEDRTKSLIAYVSNAAGNRDIWLMNAHGTGKVNVTASNATTDSDPAWSPDGSRIVFRSDRAGSNDIYVMKPDGSDVRRLTSTAGADETSPTYSPDGKMILFSSNAGGSFFHDTELYVMASNGGHVRQLTSGPGASDFGRFSPEGSRIAFYSDRNGHSAIYTMRANGSHVEQLTPDALEGAEPSWSPNGKHIAFENSFCDICDVSSIMVVKSNGKGATQLTPNDASNRLGPNWSPDGRKIAFDQGEPPTYFDNEDIWVMNSDGSHRVNLTQTPHVSDTLATWRPSRRSHED